MTLLEDVKCCPQPRAAYCAEFFDDEFVAIVAACQSLNKDLMMKCVECCIEALSAKLLDTLSEGTLVR